MMYIQLATLTFIVLMIIMMVGPFIRPVRLMLISIFEELDMAGIYRDLLAELEKGTRMPNEYLNIFKALIKIGLAIINVAFLMVAVSLLWPIVWLVAIIATLALPVWLIKRKKAVS
jgi:hypothetical protein